jgi:hypothetical protein
MATKPNAIPAAETKLAAAVHSFMDSGDKTLSIFANTVAQLAEKQGLTVAMCGAAIQREDWGKSVRTVKRLGRIARAIVEVKASMRTARIKALLPDNVYNTPGSVEQTCVAHNWGLATSGSGSAQTKTGTKTKTGPNHKTDKPETVVVKMTASKVAEYITLMAQKPAVWAALNKCLADAGLVIRALTEEEPAE